MEDDQRVKVKKESKRKGKSILGSTETAGASNTINLPVILKKSVDPDVQAASTLVVMRKQNLDPETAYDLHMKVDETIFRIQTGGKLPRYPPVESLSGVIGTCSVPIEKQLTSSDVSEGQCRLALPKGEVKESILPFLNPPGENIDDGIPVSVYDFAGSTYQMMFRSWSLSKLYVLIKGWTQFRKDHELQVKDWVIAWMFRHMDTGRLCFALTIKRHPRQE